MYVILALLLAYTVLNIAGEFNYWMNLQNTAMWNLPTAVPTELLASHLKQFTNFNSKNITFFIIMKWPDRQYSTCRPQPCPCL
jgi:hypothetical protein